MPTASRSTGYCLVFFSILLFGAAVLTSCRELPATPSPSQGGWHRMKSGTTAHLRGVFGFDSGDLYAVGDRGTILHFDGRDWRAMPSNTLSNLIGVWGTGPDNVVVTGEDGTILRYNGSTWSAMESGTTASIGALWGTSIYAFPRQLPFWAYAVADDPPGTILHFDGFQWQAMDTGASGAFIDITGWTPLWGGSGLGIMAVGRGGAAYIYDGTSWTPTDTGVDADLTAVFGDSPNNVFVIARDGAVVQNTKQFVDTGPAGSWRDVNGLVGDGFTAIAARHYNDLFIVGDGGRIVNFDRLAFTDMSSRTSVALNDVWSGGHYVVAVGDNGTILQYSDRPRIELCPLNVTVSAGEGTTPVIRWSPPCPVSKIVVEDDWHTVVWFVAADGNLIAPGVEYGTVPRGGAEWRPARVPLTEGRLYRVTLIRRDRDREIAVGTWNLKPTALRSTGSVRLGRVAGPDDSARFFHFPRLRFTGTGAQIFEITETAEVFDGDWRTIADPALRESELNIRPVIIEVLERDPDTGEFRLVILDHLRAADLVPGDSGGSVTVVWDTME